MTAALSESCLPPLLTNSVTALRVDKDEGEVINDPEESLNEDNVEDEAPKVEYKKKEFFA